jgi:hypothetical protein
MKQIIADGRDLRVIPLRVEVIEDLQGAGLQVHNVRLSLRR